MNNEMSTCSMIAAVLVAEGCDKTLEGCYTFTYEEIALKFGILLEFVREHSEEIVDEINKFYAVAGTGRDNYEIEIDFYLNYCGLGDQDEN